MLVIARRSGGVVASAEFIDRDQVCACFGPARLSEPVGWSGQTSHLVAQGALDRESVDANFSPEVSRRVCLPVLQRRSSSIGHAVDGIEKSRNSCGIYQPLWAYDLQKGLPGLNEAIVPATENRLAKAHQQFTIWHAAVTNTGGDN
jgi:hypothetical protein